MMLLYVAAALLAACSTPGERIQGVTNSVGAAEDLRSAVLNTKPLGGTFTNRTFDQNVVSGAGVAEGAVASYRLRGQATGVIEGK
jgi:hypothetical protein